MGWQRFNRTTRVFEVSDDNGGSWQILKVAAAGLDVTSPTRPNLPPEIAYEDEANTFSLLQTFNGPINVAGHQTVLGVTGTSYAGAPIEIQTVSHPRISFHWPGVVASQIGMDSAGTIRTYDNPGTGYAAFSCGRLIAYGGLFPRIWQIGGTSYIAPNENMYDIISIWGLNQTLTIGAGGGTYDGFPWTLRIRDDGVARALSWDGNYMSCCGVALPTQTAPSRTLYIGFRWNVYYGRWQMIALSQE